MKSLNCIAGTLLLQFGALAFGTSASANIDILLRSPAPGATAQALRAVAEDGGGFRTDAVEQVEVFFTNGASLVSGPNSAGRIENTAGRPQIRLSRGVHRLRGGLSLRVSACSIELDGAHASVVVGQGVEIILRAGGSIAVTDGGGTARITRAGYGVRTNCDGGRVGPVRRASAESLARAEAIDGGAQRYAAVDVTRLGRSSQTGRVEERVPSPERPPAALFSLGTVVEDEVILSALLTSPNVETPPETNATPERTRDTPATRDSARSAPPLGRIGDEPSAKEPGREGADSPGPPPTKGLEALVPVANRSAVDPLIDFAAPGERTESRLVPGALDRVRIAEPSASNIGSGRFNGGSNIGSGESQDPSEVYVFFVDGDEVPLDLSDVVSGSEPLDSMLLTKDGVTSEFETFPCPDANVCGDSILAFGEDRNVFRVTEPMTTEDFVVPADNMGDVSASEGVAAGLVIVERNGTASYRQITTDRFAIRVPNSGPEATAQFGDSEFSFSGTVDAENSRAFLLSGVGDAAGAEVASAGTFDLSAFQPATGAPVSVPEYDHLDWGLIIGSLEDGDESLELQPMGWVSGAPVSPQEISRFDGVASYAGHAFGNAADASGLRSIVGTYTNEWDFGQRSGTATLAFDGRSYSGRTAITDGGFSAVLSESGGFRGVIDGRFFGFNETIRQPEALGGDFELRGTPSSPYAASGIVAAERQ